MDVTKKKNINENGITLIALVVTIVVLLILSGIAIAMLSGNNGIITQTKESKKSNVEGEVIEKIKLAVDSARVEAKMKAMKESRYLAQEHLEDSAKIMGKDLNQNEDLISTKNKYQLVCKTGDDNGTITITYGKTTKDDDKTAITGGNDDYAEACNNKDAVIEAVVTVTKNNFEITSLMGSKIQNSTDGSGTEDLLNKDKKDEDSGGGSGDGEGGGSTKEVAIGDYVNYPIDIDNDDSGDTTKDWRVFYKDSTNIYLIASDYVKSPTGYSTPSNSPFYTTWTNAGMNTAYDSSYPYKACWGSAKSMQTNYSTLPSRFLYSGYTLNSSNTNSKCVSTLLNPTNWTQFKNTTYADYAIGGPTLEMYVASWNSLYGAGTTANTPLYCNNTNDSGYYVGNTTTPTTTSIGMSSSQGYKDTLYYPHTAAVSNCYGYWLASPSADGTDGIMNVGYYGDVNSDDYDYAYRSVRPLVSLKSSVKLTWNETGNYWTLGT